MEDNIVNKWNEVWKIDLNRTFTADFEVFGARAQNLKDAKINFLNAVK